MYQSASFWAKFWAKSHKFSEIFLNLSQFWLKFGGILKNPPIYIPNLAFYKQSFILPRGWFCYPCWWHVLKLLFDGVWGSSSETPTHFSPSKAADFYGFFPKIFANQDSFLRVFLLKNAWFYNFFKIFVKWDPLLRIFFTKMGPMSKDFW